MSNLSIDQLITPQTKDQIRAAMVTAMVQLGVRADLWVAGGVASTMLTVVAITLATFSSLISTGIRSFFLPYATGTGLKLLAYYVYGVTAPEATFATGQVTLTNAGGGVYTRGIGQLTVSNSSTGISYTNTAAFTLNGLSTLTIDVRATEAGTVGNANPGDIDTMVTVLVGVTCTNASAVIGTDAISDPALRQLCLDSLAANSARGPRASYAYAIQTATNPVSGALVNINRWTISPNSSTGVVTIVVASPSGAPDPTDVTGVATNVEAEARPDTVTVDLSGAVDLPYTATIHVYFTAPAGTSSSDAEDAIATAVADFFTNYPVGGELVGSTTGLFGTAITGAIANGLLTIPGTRLLQTTGADDMAMSGNEVATDAVTIVPHMIVPTTGVNVR